MEHPLQETQWLPRKNHSSSILFFLFCQHAQKSLEIFLRLQFGGVNKAIGRTLKNADSGHVLKKAELDTVLKPSLASLHS